MGQGTVAAPWVLTDNADERLIRIAAGC
jgi:hypothetical protein